MLPARASLAHSDPLVSSSIAFCWALHRVRRSWGRYNGRFVQADGITEEERKILNCRVVQTFDVPQTPLTTEKKRRLRAQGDMRDRPSRKALTGGVVKVCADKSGTLNTIIYEDM